MDKEGCMNKLVKIGIVGFAVFSVLLVAGIFVLKAKFPPEKIKSIAKEEISKALNRETSIGDVSISLWPLGLKVSELKIANASGKGFSETPLFNLPMMVVDIDLLQLMMFRVAIQEISLIDMTLNYEVQKDGRTNLDGLGGDKPVEVADTTTVAAEPFDISKITPLPGTFLLEKFSIKNARVLVSDKLNGRFLEIGAIDQSVSLDVDAYLTNIITSGELSINELVLKDESSGVKTGKIHLGFTHDLVLNLKDQKLKMNKLTFGFQDILITLKGEVSDFLKEVPSLDIQLESNKMMLADLLKEIPVAVAPEVAKMKAQGAASFAVSVKGKVDPKVLPQVNGNLLLESLAFAHTDVPAGINEMNGKISFTDKTLKVEPFGFKLDQHPITVLVDIDGLPTAPNVNQLMVDARIDLGQVFALASKIVAIPEGTDLKGIIDSKLNVSGLVDPAHPEKLSVNGNTLITGVVLKTPQVPDPIEVQGKLDFSNTSVNQNLAVKIGPSDVQVLVAAQDFLAFLAPEMAPGKKMNVSVNVLSQNLELDRLMPPPGPEAEVEEGSPADQLPELPDVIANVTVTLKKTLFRHLTLSDFNLLVGLRDKVATVDLNARLYEGSIQQKITADIKDTKKGLISMMMELKNVEANDFISNGNNNIVGKDPLSTKLRDLDNTLYGKMNMKMDLKTQGTPLTFVKNANGLINLSLTNGKLAGTTIAKSFNSALASNEYLQKVLKADLTDIEFKAMEASLEAKNGQLIIKKMDLKNTPIGLLELGGAVGFDASLGLTLKNTLTKSISEQLDKGNKLVQGAASKALGGTALAGAGANLSLFPKDKDGNAIFYWLIGGTLASPSVKPDSKKMVQEAGASQALDNLKDAAMNEVNKKVDELKDQGKKLADDAKKQAMEKADALKNKADAKLQETKKQADKAKDKAKDKGKEKAKEGAGKALKNIGF
jgi:ElaB/YqjD/DUF883 family membrane-anchored ribosome-binding protein